jgi:hypothetical protein
LSCSLQPPAIYLGSDCLSGTKITAPQFVVVGQQIKLAACPASSNKAEPWSDPGNTIGDYEIKNGQTTTMCVGSSCAPGMTVPTDFANINEITFYWYAAGEYKIYYYGTAGTASATVIVGAPSGVTLSPITRTPHVYYVVKAQNWALDCGDTSQATDRNCINLALNDKPQRYTLPPGVAGQFQFLQIVNCDIRSHTTSGQQNCPSSPVGQLDNSFPYASVSDQIVGIDGAMHYGAGDAPCMELLPNWSQASRQFQATMYLMWNPNLTHSIPVPLGHFKWSWHGNATMNAGSWCPDRAQQCVAGPLVDTYDDFIPATPALTDFPTWNTVYSNVPSNTPTNDPCTLLKQN